MISETTFASNFTSVWKSLTPTSELFVRKINGGLYERVFTPMNSVTAPSRRALINEVAFTLFVRHGDTLVPHNARRVSDLEIAACFAVAHEAITRLDRVHSSDVAEMDRTESDEAVRQAIRLATFFLAQNRGAIMYNPDFQGCGMINSCFGDVLVGGALYEVKAGERRFRSVDIRQVLVYAALNYQANSHDIRTIGLFNPRTGVSFKASLDEFCFEVSGQASPDLLADIVRAFSSGEMSR